MHNAGMFVLSSVKQFASIEYMQWFLNQLVSTTGS